MAVRPAEPGLRERKKAATRQAIHEAALRLGADGGIAGVTVEEICAVVDIAPRTFFNYYPSKAAAVFDLRTEEILAEALEVFTSASGNILEDACDLVAPYISLPADLGRIKDALGFQPELRHELLLQLMCLIKPLFPAFERRTGDAHSARVAMGLLLAAVNTAMARSDVEATPLAQRLRVELNAMQALLPD